MNNKVLVPTDFSANSIAGIRFAIQMSKQNKRSLTFYHHLRLLKPTRWSEKKYESYVETEFESAQRKLTEFVKDIYKQARIAKPKLNCVVGQGLNVQESILNFAVEMGAGSICMGTRGAGRLKKIIGTNASAILTKAPIPVFIVPGNYRRTPITNVLYASDFQNLKKELRTVTSFGKTVKAKVSVYHYDYLLEVPETKRKLEKVAARFKNKEVKFKFQKLNLDQPFAAQLNKDVKKSKATLLVLFTDQKRGWFDKIFLPAKSSEIAFDAKVPLLIFPKADKR